MIKNSAVSKGRWGAYRHNRRAVNALDGTCAALGITCIATGVVGASLLASGIEFVPGRSDHRRCRSARFCWCRRVARLFCQGRKTRGRSRIGYIEAKHRPQPYFEDAGGLKYFWWWIQASAWRDWKISRYEKKSSGTSMHLQLAVSLTRRQKTSWSSAAASRPAPVSQKQSKSSPLQSLRLPELRVLLPHGVLPTPAVLLGTNSFFGPQKDQTGAP